MGKYNWKTKKIKGEKENFALLEIVRVKKQNLTKIIEEQNKNEMHYDEIHV